MKDDAHRLPAVQREAVNVARSTPIDRTGCSSRPQGDRHSDDPAYFGGYVGDNYRAVARARGLDKAALTTLACNSFTGSFLADADIARHVEAVETYASAH